MRKSNNSEQLIITIGAFLAEKEADELKIATIKSFNDCEKILIKIKSLKSDAKATPNFLAKIKQLEYTLEEKEIEILDKVDRCMEFHKLSHAELEISQSLEELKGIKKEKDSVYAELIDRLTSLAKDIEYAHKLKVISSLTESVKYLKVEMLNLVDSATAHTEKVGASGHIFETFNNIKLVIEENERQALEEIGKLKIQTEDDLSAFDSKATELSKCIREKYYERKKDIENNLSSLSTEISIRSTNNKHLIKTSYIILFISSFFIIIFHISNLVLYNNFVSIIEILILGLIATFIMFYLVYVIYKYSTRMITFFVHEDSNKYIMAFIVGVIMIPIVLLYEINFPTWLYSTLSIPLTNDIINLFKLDPISIVLSLLALLATFDALVDLYKRFQETFNKTSKGNIEKE